MAALRFQRVRRQQTEPPCCGLFVELKFPPAFDVALINFGDARHAGFTSQVRVRLAHPRLARGAAGLAGGQRDDIRDALVDLPTVVRIDAALVPVSSLPAWLNSSRTSAMPIVRCMPNTPASVGFGMTVLYASAAVSPSQKECAYSLMSSVGRAIWVGDECQFDAVTALSGSGPAYAYLLMEAMIDAGRQLGLPTEAAEILTRQTVLDAPHLASDPRHAIQELRRQVTSPGGTTEAAINVLQENGFKPLMERAVHAAALRSAELASQLWDAGSD